MRRTILFVSMLMVSVVALLLVVLWYLTSYQAGSGSLGGMMQQMMGGQSGVGGTVASMPAYVWTSVAALSILSVVGVAGLVYYLAYPEIKTGAPSFATPVAAASVPPNQISAKENWETVVRTSNPEEKKVLEVLAGHGGTYLQKFIVKESGLSKLKTHRIVSRFAERGIVSASKSGNTNEVSLSPWLKHDLPAKHQTS
jgi:hypothetical protein